MQPSLFDQMTRDDKDPANYSEPLFDYLNRSAREHFENARSLLDTWYLEYTRCHADSASDMRSRFRSNIDEHHLSALTELYLHNLLIEQGYSPEIHPAMEGTTRRPDFAAMSHGKVAFYLEAVLVYEASEDARSNTFRANILDAIDRIDSPDFLVSLDIKCHDAKHQPRTGAIRRFLQERINTLDWDEVCRDYETHRTLPSWQWNQDDWALEFTASPVTQKGRKRRTANSRVSGMTSAEVKLIRTDEAIRSSLFKKVSQYGKPAAPLIIAVNVLRDSLTCDDAVVMEALFGKEIFTVTVYEDGTQNETPGRDRNGIWISPGKGWINNHLSGLLVLRGLKSSVAEAVSPILWHHPAADFPLGTGKLNISQWVLDQTTGAMKEVESHSPSVSDG